MSLESAFRDLLAPMVDRIEAASQQVTEQMEFARRIETSGLPPDRIAFTVPELSNMTTFDEDTIRELFHTGVLQGRQTGRRILIYRWSVLEFLGLTDPTAKKKARR